MPFRGLSRKQFADRENELSILRRLAESGTGPVCRNVILDGPYGIGKTELLKQLYGELFHQSKEVVPFYYAFQRATLEPAAFARDFVSAFVRQYLGFVRKDPGIVENAALPLKAWWPLCARLGFHWLVDLAEAIASLPADAGAHEWIRAALSVPAVSARQGSAPVLVLLDDFQLVEDLGRGPGAEGRPLWTLFAPPLGADMTPHVLAVSPQGALEAVFGDSAFRGTAERFTLLPLPEDRAFAFFQDLCSRLDLQVAEEIVGVMGHLGGNPRYIRQMATGLWRMQKHEVRRQDFWECYAYEVAEGQVAFYWSALLGGMRDDPQLWRLTLEILHQGLEHPAAHRDLDRLALGFDRPLPEIRNLLRTLGALGVIQRGAGFAPLADPVFQDFVRARYMQDIEGRDPDQIRSTLQWEHRLEAAQTGFEMTIPMDTDAELVAARAIEQLCRNIRLETDVVSQIQLALIEACLNAKEHSGSYEKKMNLRCNIEPARVEIAVESPGKPFSAGAGGDPTVEEKLGSDHKRGWGLKLMRELMDEVRVETVGHRTRVILVKQLPQE